MVKKVAGKIAKKRIVGFDALKCFAIILVVIYHVFPGVFPGGFLAVEIFFAISGFLIVQKLIKTDWKEKEKFGDIKSFWQFFWGRLKRFLPTLLFCMILTLSLAYFADPDILTGARQNSLYAVTFSTNIMSIINGTTYENSLIPNFFNQTWFLALELQVCVVSYLVIAGFFQFLPIEKFKTRRRYKQLTAVCVLIAVLSFVLMAIYGGRFRLFDRAYFGIDSHIGAFFAGGALAAFSFAKKIVPAKKDKRWAWILLLILSIVGVGAMVPFINYASPETFVIALPMTTAASLVMIMSVLKLQNASGVKSKIIKVLEYVGTLSFAIYLLHYSLYIVLPSLLNFWPLEVIPYIVIVASVVLAILLQKVLMPFSVKHKVWFWLLLMLSLILPVMALIKAPDRSSIEESLNVVAENADETAKESVENVKIDYSGMVGVANTLNNDVMKYFDSATAYAKPYPVYIGGGITYSLSGRAYYNTPNYSRVSALNSARVMVLGDSVVVGATNAIYNTVSGAFVDALQSRNMTDAINLLAGYRAANGGKLPYVIVIGLVTNYVNFGVDTIRTIMDTAGPGHQFVFVTGYCGDYSREAQNNVLKWVANNYSNVRVADWVSVVVPNVNSYTYADHTHLTPAGRQAYANLINGVVSGL
ncbi:acyltransferase [Candidatus Saccharibacteria bacterium]|nr:acyltransferase [Candidatus Saccharibacteria bacterium]